MYRAVTVAALEARTDVSDAAALADLAQSCDIRLENGQDGETLIFLNGRDITARLRAPDVDSCVSAVSAVPGVRRVLVEAQRKIAAGGGLVMAGRDIGTVVLRDAEAKFFITASPETRARRRHEEVRRHGSRESYDEVLRSLRRRDELDSTRADSPLAPAPDAHVIATDGLTLDEVVDRLEGLVAARA
jgi:cytidylate kinase